MKTNRFLFRSMLCGAVVLAAAGSALAGSSFETLGDLPGGTEHQTIARGVSGDGSTVVGRSGSSDYWHEAFRWTADGGIQGLGTLGLPSGASPDDEESEAFGINGDGSVIVGETTSASSFREAFRWTADGGMQSLGFLSDDWRQSTAHGVSADGSVVVGVSRLESSSWEAFRWTSETGMVGLGDLPEGTFNSGASGVSADGEVIVGGARSDSGPEASRWTSESGMVGLGDLPGGTFFSHATAISADGSTIVGRSSSESGSEAFRWTAEGGMVRLGIGLPEDTYFITPNAISADGSVVVGRGRGPGENSEAVIWDEAHGMRFLKDVLEDNHNLDLTGWTLSTATGISADGRTIVGFGGPPDIIGGAAWRAVLSEHPAAVPAPGAFATGVVLLGVLGLRRRRR